MGAEAILHYHHGKYHASFSNYPQIRALRVASSFRRQWRKSQPGKTPLCGRVTVLGWRSRGPSASNWSLTAPLRTGSRSHLGSVTAAPRGRRACALVRRPSGPAAGGRRRQALPPLPARVAGGRPARCRRRHHSTGVRCPRRTGALPVRSRCPPSVTALRVRSPGLSLIVGLVFVPSALSAGARARSVSGGVRECAPRPGTGTAMVKEVITHVVRRWRQLVPWR